MRSTEQILEKIKIDGLNVESKRISWEDKWLGHAFLTSLRSIDARTKCGCVLVSQDNTIVSEGYNGFLRGIKDGLLPNYLNNEDPLLCKYSWIPHAETNSIINAARIGSSVKGCIAYITAKPCISCIQQLWQAGITKIIVPKNSFCTPKCLETETYKEQLQLFNFITKNQLPIIEVECTIDIAQKAF